MTVSFHKYGEYFPGTGDLRVSSQCYNALLPIRFLQNVFGSSLHSKTVEFND